MTAAPPAALLSGAARARRSSAIRDLLDHARRPGLISLAGGIPAPELLPVDRIRELAASVGPAALQYGPTAGEPELRAVAAALTHDRARPGDVVVTTGSQQGLALVARVLLDPGDTAVVGAPDYLGALQVLGETGARLEVVPVDDAGLDTGALEDRLRAGLRPKLVYLVGHFHNPTGATLTLSRREHLAGLAERHGFVIVDDDPYRELWFDRPPFPALAAGSDRVVHLRSASKTLSPGLRVGWMAAPPWLVGPVVTAKQADDLHTSSLSQRLVHGLLTDRAWMTAHLERLRDHYRARRDALLDALARHLGPRASASRPAGGLFLWVRVAGVDTAGLLPPALAAGVAFVPGAAFAADPDRRSDRLRLSFATAGPAELDEAARRLASVVPPASG